MIRITRDYANTYWTREYIDVSEKDLNEILDYLGLDYIEENPEAVWQEVEVMEEYQILYSKSEGTSSNYVVREL